MKNLKFILLAFIVSMSFTSCSNDDDPEVNKVSITGKWQQTWVKAVNADGTVDYDEAVTYYPSIIEINSNRTWKEDGLIGYWTLEGTALNVVYPTTASESGWAAKWTVIKLTDDTLIMSIKNWDDFDGELILDNTTTKTFIKIG